ncbi:MAG: nucleotidyltransferase [Eubacteriales bacterium]|nr:nucleotidyltransferase [Eubacteriales bacterium]
MKTAGIIAEYNPFHAGHLYQLEYTREKLGADMVIVAMSGDYVQRGTPALLPKHVRAEMALRCGADLVLELPVAAATASAEFFAGCGVELLDSLGVVDFLCFGSEAGEIKNLQMLAEILNREPEEYRQVLKENLKNGLSYPTARSRALEKYIHRYNPSGRHTGLHDAATEIPQILSSPNNILGIEYCKALLKQNSSIVPVTLKRRGYGYHDTGISSGQFASASAIRHLIRTGDSTDVFSAQIPAPALALLEKSIKSNSCILEQDFDLLLQYRLLSETPKSLCRYLDISQSLAQRIINQRSQFQGFRQFSALLKTKEITQTRIQRALLHILLNIESAPQKIPYARVLGFRRDSGALLKTIKQKSSIPLVTKLSDAHNFLDKYAMSLLEETAYASNVYQTVLSRKTGIPFVHEYEQRIVICT